MSSDPAHPTESQPAPAPTPGDHDVVAKIPRPEFQTADRLRAQLPACMAADRLWATPRLDQVGARLVRGLPCERSLAEISARLDASVATALRRGDIPLTITYPEALPVSAHRDAVLALLRDHRAVVLTGETGSGKTTQFPKMLLEAGLGRRGMIALTQPRRVAAVAMAARIGSELAAPNAVAHSVRFDDRATPDTLIRVMTDGLLLAEAAGDPLLSRYDAVVIDEAHERNLNVDLLLGVLRRLRAKRPELLIAVASASIAAERFAAYLGSEEKPAPVIAVSGRAFPVEIVHRPPADEDVGYLGALVAAIEEVHHAGDPGDILAFLPTERDIIEAARRLHDLPGATVLPLFSRLTPNEQQRVFAPMRGRKIVLSTNIAETSLTIPGITCVIDTGLARLKRYQASSRTERLPIEAVSQASLTQRAGRAGRVAPGRCIRLFPIEDAQGREAFTAPEILRSNLAGVVLQCLVMDRRASGSGNHGDSGQSHGRAERDHRQSHRGERREDGAQRGGHAEENGETFGEPEDFPWLDAPAPGAWHQARLLLDELGAFLPARATTAEPTPENPAPAKARSVLSPLGRALAAIPADPQVARILLAGVAEGVPHEACTIAAFLTVQDPRVRPPGQEAKADSAHKAISHEAGDLATILVLWEHWQGAASNSARSRLCAASFLGYRRMREWADVRHQLWSGLREQRIHAGKLPPHGHELAKIPHENVHRAVLAGMLGNVLMYDRELRCYRGAGDRQLYVHPGSALRAGKADDGKRAPPPPPWLVACEVVETSRLYARLCAPIDPEWVIALAGDRVRRRHRDPHWHPQRGQVVCTETVTWKGLPIRDGRLVPYERVDPAAASAIFVREALCADIQDADSAIPAEDNDDGVEPGRRTDPAWQLVAANRRTWNHACGLRHRLREPRLWLERTQVERFYREKLGLDGGPEHAAPPVVASTAAFRKAWNELGDRLRLRLDDLVDAPTAARAGDFPERVRMGGRDFPLTYRFYPGDDADGATIDIGEDDLARIDPTRLPWLIPGWLPDIVTNALEQLPKDSRRQLIPLAVSAQGVAADLLDIARGTTGDSAKSSPPNQIPVSKGAAPEARKADRTVLGEPPDAAPPNKKHPLNLPTFAAAFSQVLHSRHKLSSAPPDPGAWPPHCRLRFRIRDSAGAVIFLGRDPAALAAQAAAFGDPLAGLKREWDTAVVQGWPGDCPPSASAAGTTGHPAVLRARDERGRIAVRRTVFATAASAGAWHGDGIEAALESALDAELEAIATAPAPLALTARCERTLPGRRLGGLRRHLALGAALGAGWSGAPRGGVRDAAAFSAALNAARAALPAAARDADPLIGRVLDHLDRLRTRLGSGAKSLGAATAARTAADGRDRLLACWPMGLPSASALRADRFLDGWCRLLERPASSGDEISRLCARIAALAEAADVVPEEPRLLAALGQTPLIRAVAGQFQECALALCTATGGGGNAGAAEIRLRQDAGAVAAAVAKARGAIAQARAELLAVRPLLPRLPAGSKARLTAAVEQALAEHPELGTGADLDAQHAAVLALCARVRGAVVH
jgi:ATP-dependent helicase HrpA